MKFEPNWKVIHLSTSSIGGAGLAARRLNESLNHAGIDSKFFALQNRFFKNEINEFEKQVYININEYREKIVAILKASYKNQSEPKKEELKLLEENFSQCEYHRLDCFSTTLRYH